MASGDVRDQFQTACATARRSPISRTPLRAHGANALVMLALVGALATSVGGCASASGGSTTRLSATATPARTSDRANPIGDGLFCATQFVWSPDASRIAVVGNGVNCSGAASGRTPGLFLIYDRSGRLLQKLHPDTTVLTQPTIAQRVAANAAAGGMISTLTYDNLTWTPDSRALLMTYDLELQANANEGSVTGAQGVQRLGLSDPSLTKVWLDPTTSRTSATIERWDLTTGAPSWVPDPASSSMYKWSADGLLSPAVAAVGRPIGTPDGGKMFAAWQPGSLLFATKSDKASENITVLSQDIAWVSYISPLSPDARYYYPTLIASGSLVPPSTQHAFAYERMLQPHDQALAALAHQMMRTPSPSQNTSVFVAWRPDGRYLAAFSPDAAAPNPAAFTVFIYDTATGALVKRIMPDFTGLRPGAAGSPMLAWSPDGTRLLLADSVYGAITIWGPGALPA